MTDNKLQLNEDKTEALLLISSKLQDPPASLSIRQTTVSFSDSVRNPGFYLDIDLSMKKHVNIIARQLSLNSTVSALFDFYVSVHATKILVIFTCSL